MPDLVVGPMLRYVDTRSASVWVETAAPGRVAVEAGDVRAEEATFTVHGHHYALVDLSWPEGRPGGGVPYTVEVDGERLWPLEGEQPSRIGTFPAHGPRRVLFGSCRTSVPHDAAHTISHGIDTLREYGMRLRDTPEDEWPDLMLFLGDQVYADEPPAQMYDVIRARRQGDAPLNEIADFEEYAELYRLAWAEPEIRWLLSTVPTAMIFDDHDLRDDWNTSQAWRDEVEQLPWWRRRLVAGLGAYYVYQHLGNLSPAERAEDSLFAKLLEHDGDGAEMLDAFAEESESAPDATRWSYARDLGDTRLIMLDSRCGRRLTPGDRRMIDGTEYEWLVEQLDTSAGHVVIGSSVPFLLPMGIHHVESWNEAVCDGAWGRFAARWGEKVRQALDLEHWGAFRRSFEDVGRRLAEVRGTVVLLSGDVHYSYVAKARGLPIYQLVCSPIRNPLSPFYRLANVVASFAVAGLVGGWLARLTRIPRPPFAWQVLQGPWFANTVATLTLDEVTTVRWESPGETVRLATSRRAR